MLLLDNRANKISSSINYNLENITMRNSGYCLGFIWFFISMCLYGCKDNTEESITETFEIATEDLIQNFSKDASSVTIPITTNLNTDGWKAQTTDKWLRATQFKSSLKISVDANIGTDRRTASVKVTSATKHYTITDVYKRQVHRTRTPSSNRGTYRKELSDSSASRRNSS